LMHRILFLWVPREGSIVEHHLAHTLEFQLRKWRKPCEMIISGGDQLNGN
jgi:hypothetical protein